MDPTTTQIGPVPGTGYVPYFYQRGLHYLYSIPEGKKPSRGYESAPPGFDFTSDLVGRRPSYRPLTVEQIIATGYLATPAAEPAFAILEDRHLTSRLGLDDVISQIRRRYEIHDQVLYSIDSGICASINAIYLHEAYRGSGSADSKQHYAKHKAIQKLYEEKRLEETTLWKDVSRLRTLLPENAQAYLGAHRKLAIVKSEPGDAP